MPAVHHASTGDMDRLPLTRTIDEAKTAALLAGYRTMRLAAMDTPAKFDPMLAAFAVERRLLPPRAHRAAHQPTDRSRLRPAARRHTRRTRRARRSGRRVTGDNRRDPPCRVRRRPTPSPGSCPPRACRCRTRSVPCRTLGTPRIEAAELLGATATEMRTAGCTPVEIIATRPRDVLRSLPDDPHLWELAAGTMAAAGHSPATIAGHLVTHAPSADTFAAALTVGVDDPTAGVAMAIRCGAQGDQLAAVTEAYGLSPTETATALVDHRCPDHVLLDTLDVRCDHDTDTVVALAGGAGLSTEAIESWMNPVEPVIPPIARWGGLDLGDAAELLASLPTPQAAGTTPRRR